jgi:hypothetical protein
VADADGRYRFDTTAFVDLVGGDGLAVKYTAPNGSQVSANATVPHVVAYLDRSHVSGSGNPSSETTLTVRDRAQRVVFATDFRTNTARE